MEPLLEAVPDPGRWRGCSRLVSVFERRLSPALRRLACMLLVAGLATGSIMVPCATAFAHLAPQASPQDASARDAEMIRRFIAAVEADSWDIPELVIGAAAAEPRLGDWPSSLPDRATVRGLITFFQSVRTFSEALRTNDSTQLNAMQLMSRMMDGVGQIDRERAPHIWVNAQLIFASFASQYFPVLRDEFPEWMWPHLLANYRELWDSLAQDEGRFTPAEQARLLAATARLFAPDVTFQREGDDLATGIDYYRRALRLALAADDSYLARTLLVDAASATFGIDPSGLQAQDIIGFGERIGPTGWLERRSVYELRARIARLRGDHAAELRYSDLWMSAVNADLDRSRMPFWRAQISDIGQISYLAAPLRAGDPEMALARFDRLAEAMRRQGDFDPGTPTDLPETSAGIATPATGAFPYVELGVDVVITGVEGEFSDAIWLEATQRASAGDISPMPPGSEVDWGAVRIGDRTGRTAVTRSGIDPRLWSVEMGRGLASAPAQARQMRVGATDDADFDDLRRQMRRLLPVYENQFYAAFGRPIDELAGGRCASDRSLVGAPPRILLILPAKLSSFPVEMARAPNGRRLIDCYEFRRAPTLAAARQSAQRWQRRRLEGISGIWNPAGDLPFTQAEIPVITAAFGSPGAVSTLDGTSASTILRPPGADVVHIASHGRFGYGAPFESGLLVRFDRVLTLGEITQAPEPATARLVVLSACEAGLSSPLSGEVAHWGLASAFLASGVGGVVGALWRVNDGASVLVIGKFYELLLRNNRPPAAALREAQLWVRDASTEELLAFLETGRPYVDARSRVQFEDLRGAVVELGRATPAGATPFADPMLWGGFAYFGTYIDR